MSLQNLSLLTIMSGENIPNWTLLICLNRHLEWVKFKLGLAICVLGLVTAYRPLQPQEYKAQPFLGWDLNLIFFFAQDQTCQTGGKLEGPKV